jgi:hypothetical protein
MRIWLMRVLHDMKAIAVYGRRVSGRCTSKEGPDNTNVSLFLHDTASFGYDLLQRARIPVGAQGSDRFPIRTINELIPRCAGTGFGG